ncbi:MAG: site-specific DNA-methyltransferase [Chromatiales bacterium]|nr:site-specific DNA-methyltransferase [Chromatiales bacterium]
MTRAEIYFGDCLDLMGVLPDASVNLIFCDLPYGTTNCKWDSPILLSELWRQYKRILAPGGCVVLFGAMPFTAHLVMSNPSWFKDHLVWNKNKCGSPGLAKYRPMRVHEDLLVFAPGTTVYNPQMEEGEPYARKSKNPDGYVGRKNDHGYGLKPRTEFKNEGTRYPKSILNFSRDFSAQQQIHSAQKPVSLCKWVVLTYSKPGDVVLDNTMGSSSSGIACHETGRSYIGMENDLEEYRKAKGRVPHATRMVQVSLRVAIEGLARHIGE